MTPRSGTNWLVCLCATSVLLAATIAEARLTPQPAAPTPATIADAKPFLGTWTTVLQSPQGPLTFDIEVHLDSGDPGATVSNDMVGQTEVTDVTKSGAALVLRYGLDVQGMHISVAVSLVPEGDTLKADFSFMDGQFAVSSVATRKK